MELRGRDRINLAIFSPNKESYSETFIKIQKENLPHNIFFYFDGILPTREGNDVSLRPNLIQGIWSRVLKSGKKPLASNIVKSLRKNKVDVVLAQFGPMGAALVPICKEAKIPLVVHFHGADAYLHRYINPGERYQKLFRNAAKIIVVSDDMKQQLLNLGAPHELLVQTCYGPRKEFFDLSPEYKSKQFLAVGRFVEKKAPYFTVLAFSKVLQVHPDAKLVMAGDGPLLGVCKNLVKYLKIEHAVTFSGPLSHRDVKNLMEVSLCFVQHSLTAEDGDKEGSPVAIIEAGAAALPVVATAHAGINLTVVHGQTGYLVQEGDVDGMAEYMIKICSDFSLARKLGNNGRLHININATVEKYIDDLNRAILDVVSIGLPGRRN